MLKRLSLAAAVALCLSAAVLATPALAEPLKVVASFSILGDMVREVGGDAVSVTTLVGPDGDAHVYQPSPADAKAVAEADVVIPNGLGFEPWGDRLLKASGTKAAVAKAAQGVKPRQMEAEEEHGHGGKVTDPHAWQDLSNGKLYVANIAKALAAARPADAGALQSRADAYAKRLTELDAWVRSELGAIPQANRKIITGHDAFGYFGHAYGVTFLAPVGISTETEPTPQGCRQAGAADEGGKGQGGVPGKHERSPPGRATGQGCRRRGRRHPLRRRAVRRRWPRRHLRGHVPP